MAGDTYTPTKIRAIKEGPQGQQPGEVFEVTADVADILVLHELAERVPETTPTASKSTYKCRDLTAEKR